MKSVNIVFSCSLELYYIFSLLLFIVNKDYFVSNSVYHNINTKQTKKKWFTLASGISGHVSEGSFLFTLQNF